MAKVTGKAYISLDGTKLHSKPDGELSVGGDIKKAQTSVHGLVGHSVEEIQPGKITCTLVHTANIDVVALKNWEGNAVLETDTGLRYMVRDAAIEDDITLKGAEVPVTITGQPAVLI